MALRTMTKPIKFSDTPGPAGVAPPMFGQYSDEVPPANGYSAADTASLRERGIVR
jgi:crotonobetainyl-CoA:carnitine CoA-transferase CaiB-like acyl-CoA transferase